MAKVKEISEKQVINIDVKDIEKVKKFRSDYAEITARLGEIEVELINAGVVLDNIKAAKENFVNQFKQLRADEVTLTNEFNEKYGAGEFDIDNGTLLLSHKYNRFEFFDVFIDIIKTKKKLIENQMAERIVSPEFYERKGLFHFYLTDWRNWSINRFSS